MYFYDSHRHTLRAYHMQRRYKGRLCQNKIILDLKPPINPKQVRVLLGHTGYYRKFIRHYSDMTYPLEELLKDDQDFIWTEEWQISFDKLKRKLVEAPILKFPNWSAKFHVHIDASGIAIGAILTQPGDDGMDYPIVYSSWKLNKAERERLLMFDYHTLCRQPKDILSLIFLVGFSLQNDSSITMYNHIPFSTYK